MLIGMPKRSEPDQVELVLDAYAEPKLRQADQAKLVLYRKNLLAKAATILQSFKGQSSLS